MRTQFVQEVLDGKKTKAALCRQYGISRPTGDLWLKRYMEGLAMTDGSHAPHRVRGRTPEKTEALIVQYRQQFPAAGAVKIRQIMLNDGHGDLPCAKTFNNIFHRYGLITKEASLAATPYIRYQRERPNQLWQGDFKGHFTLGNGQRCYPLNILDDHSRFCLASVGLKGETFEELQPVFGEILKEYGLPETFLCDNGNPWGVAQSAGFTRFEVWLMELGILTIHGRPLHPQTQGKLERFNGSLKREYLKFHQFENMAEAQRGLDAFRQYYNQVRPHKALDLATPASCYEPSVRPMPEKIEDWQYGPEYSIRRVREHGYFTFRGKEYFLSIGFRNKDIAIRDSHIPGQMTVMFRQFRIARFDPCTGKFTMRKASRAL